MKIYCLSGLGVDERAFQNLHLPEVELIHIPWIEPQKNESLAAYSNRLFHSVEIDESYMLLGVSFGGMVAAEFAKIRKPKKLFLISTIHSTKEFSTLFKIGAFLNLHKIIPGSWMIQANALTFYLFGVKNEEEKGLLKEILKDTNPAFLKWAITAIISWENYCSSGVNIHGTNDKILPLNRKVDVEIKDGGHFMIVSKASEISTILQNELMNDTIK